MTCQKSTRQTTSRQVHNAQNLYYSPPPLIAVMAEPLAPLPLRLSGGLQSRLDPPNLSSSIRVKLRTSVPVPLSAPPNRVTRLRQPLTNPPRLSIRRSRRLPPSPLSVNRRLTLAPHRISRPPKGASRIALIECLACPPETGLLNMCNTLVTLTPPLVASESLLLPIPRQTAASDIFYLPVVPAIDTPTAYSAPKHAPRNRLECLASNHGTNSFPR